MKTVAFFAPAAAGHVNPTLGVAAELVRRGHRVTYATPQEYAARVAETGAEVVPFTSSWDTPDGGAPPQMHGKELARAMRLLLRETESALAQLRDAERPDLVVHDGPLAWWGRVLARRWEVPSVEIWPNLVSNEQWSLHHKYTTFNPLSPGFLLLMGRMAAFLRRQGLGGDLAGFTRGSWASLRLVMLPRAFQYEGETFQAGYRFVGPALTDRAFQGDWQPPDDLPVVLVSLGTGYNDRPDFFRTVLQAADGRPWRVVAATGPTDLAAIGPLPPNVEAHPRVPQLAVLRHARAFVTHAGMGGVMEGLSFGVPLVAVPQMAEQRANADRVAALGLGRHLAPETVTAETLWEAVEQVAADSRVRERLDWMRGEIAAAGGAPAAADEIEKLLGP